MNLILLKENDFIGECIVQLTDQRRVRHMLEVLRAKKGDVFTVGFLHGNIGKGKVESISSANVVMTVQLGESPPAVANIDIVLAMPRPKVLRKILSVISPLGIGRLVLVNSFRVEKSYFDSPLLQPEAIRSELELGLEQGRDTRLPEVLVRKRFKPFVEDEMAVFWKDCQKLVAHPSAVLQWNGQDTNGPNSVVLAIGPEGGWIPYEVDLLAAHGFKKVSFGPRILRVETAIPYAVGQWDIIRRNIGNM